jgi:hypothetical protein
VLIRLVTEVLPNNPLTAINKEELLVGCGKYASTSLKEAAKQQRQLNQIGWARANSLAALRALD